MSQSSTLPTGHAVVSNDLQDITKRAGAELAGMGGDSLLIVGGGGFLGYYLVQSVLEWNTEHPDEQISVTIFDNWFRGKPRWLAPLHGDALRVETVDITEPLLGSPGEYDWIIHAASVASPTFYRRHPIETMDANVNGLRNLLEYARSAMETSRQVRGFLFFSTSEIYGDPTPDAIPTPETYRGNVSCTGPRACYDESKRYGETLSVNFAAEYGIPVKIARPFNNYGPGLRITDRRVIPDFAGDIIADRDIVMHSSGTPTRTFCYVTDAIVGYYKILVQGRVGEPYNIGSERPEISMKDLATNMADIGSKAWGYAGEVVHVDSDDDDYLTDNPSRRKPAIEKARSELGYEPIVSLDDGLRRSLAWYRDIGPTGDL